jgi:hypothetical protein
MFSGGFVFDEFSVLECDKREKKEILDAHDDAPAPRKLTAHMASISRVHQLSPWRTDAQLLPELKSPLPKERLDSYTPSKHTISRK